MKNIIFLILAFKLNCFAATITCPPSPNLVYLKVDVEVNFDKKTQDYVYKYRFENSKQSQHTIDAVFLDVLKDTDITVPSKLPVDWYSYRQKKSAVFEDHLGIRIQGLKDLLEIGESATGFEIRSKLKPGPITYGILSIPSSQVTVVQAPGEVGEGPEFEEAQFVCPGFFSKAYGIDSDFIKGVTIGPVPANKVIVESRIKRIKDKKYSGSHKKDADYQLSSIESGKIKLLILGSKDVNVSKIDADSLKFGQGQAKPTKIEIIGNVKDEECDDDMKSHFKEHKNVQHLLVEFDLKDVDLKCEIDRALFLRGTYNKTQELFSAVKIKQGLCDKKVWVKEEKFMREHDRKQKNN